MYRASSRDGGVNWPTPTRCTQSTTPDDLELGCSINGERMQKGRTRDLIFIVPACRTTATPPNQPGLQRPAARLPGVGPCYCPRTARLRFREEPGEEQPATTFTDIAAVVQFLRITPWPIPDFSIGRYRPQLHRPHQQPGDRPIVVHSHRFFVTARPNPVVTPARGSAFQARPRNMRFQYIAGSPRRLRYHMSRRSLVVSMNGIVGVGSIV